MLATKYFLQANNVPSLHYLMSSGNIQPLLYLLDEPTWEGTNVLWESLDLNRKQIVEELPFLESDGFYEITKKNNRNYTKICMQKTDISAPVLQETENGRYPFRSSPLGRN